MNEIHVRIGYFQVFRKLIHYVHNIMYRKSYVFSGPGSGSLRSQGRDHETIPTDISEIFYTVVRLLQAQLQFQSPVLRLRICLTRKTLLTFPFHTSMLTLLLDEMG